MQGFLYVYSKNLAFNITVLCTFFLFIRTIATNIMGALHLFQATAWRNLGRKTFRECIFKVQSTEILNMKTQFHFSVAPM